LEIVVNKSIETRTTAMDALPFGIEKKRYAKERHSRCGEWPLRI
jgi:hypothetical protein